MTTKIDNKFADLCEKKAVETKTLEQYLNSQIPKKLILVAELAYSSKNYPLARIALNIAKCESQRKLDGVEGSFFADAYDRDYARQVYNENMEKISKLKVKLK
jgi:hypothetical protein